MYCRVTDSSTKLQAKQVEDPIEEAFLNCFRQIYSSLSPQLASPRRYTAFVHTYALLYNKRRESIIDQVSQLKAGVFKLDEARRIVETLRTDAASQEIILATKRAEARDAFDLITATMRNANNQRISMEALRQQTLRENAILLEQYVKSITT